MAVERQRFCPVCDRLFNEGEAVLRCSGCQVQHHPACWVRNGGCATDGAHEATPEPEAYGMVLPRPAPVGAETATRRPATPPSAAIPEPAPVIQRSAVTPPVRQAASPAPDEFVIGRTAPNVRSVRPVDPPPAPAPVERPRAKAGRYPDLSGANKVKPMPSIYPGHRFLRFWYVPVALLLAVGVAFGVIIGADRIFSGDGEQASAANDDATATTAAGAATTATPTATEDPDDQPGSQVTIVATPGGDGTVVPPASGALAAGGSAVVIDTGDCLNVRTAPGLGNDAVVCVPDGTVVTVLGGPTEADGFTWWQLETPQGTGWAAADYLAPE